MDYLFLAKLLIWIESIAVNVRGHQACHSRKPLLLALQGLEIVTRGINRDLSFDSQRFLRHRRADKVWFERNKFSMLLNWLGLVHDGDWVMIWIDLVASLHKVSVAAALVLDDNSLGLDHLIRMLDFLLHLNPLLLEILLTNNQA